MKRRDPLASLRLLTAASAPDEATLQAEANKTRAAFLGLLEGTASPQDFDRVAMEINTCKLRALDIGNSGVLLEALTAAQLANTAIRNRYMKWGKFQVLDTEKPTINAALEVCEAIIAASTPLQMQQAYETMLRSLKLQMKGKK